MNAICCVLLCCQNCSLSSSPLTLSLLKQMMFVFLFCPCQVAKAPRLKRSGAWSQRTLTTWSTFTLAALHILFLRQFFFFNVSIPLQTSSWVDFPLQVAARWRASRIDRPGFKAWPHLLCKTGLLLVVSSKTPYTPSLLMVSITWMLCSLSTNNYYKFKSIAEKLLYCVLAGVFHSVPSGISPKKKKKIVIEL